MHTYKKVWLWSVLFIFVSCAYFPKHGMIQYVERCCMRGSPQCKKGKSWSKVAPEIDTLVGIMQDSCMAKASILKSEQ